MEVDAEVDADAAATTEMKGPDGEKFHCPVTGEPGIDLSKVVSAQVFKDWAGNIDADDKLFIELVHVQSLDMFGPRVGFIKFVSTAKVHVGGEKGVISVPGIVFMRGGAVSSPALDPLSFVSLRRAETRRWLTWPLQSLFANRSPCW